jgi:hypothetical protein
MSRPTGISVPKMTALIGISTRIGPGDAALQRLVLVIGELERDLIEGGSALAVADDVGGLTDCEHLVAADRVRNSERLRALQMTSRRRLATGAGAVSEPKSGERRCKPRRAGLAPTRGRDSRSPVDRFPRPFRAAKVTWPYPSIAAVDVPGISGPGLSSGLSTEAT